MNRSALNAEKIGAGSTPSWTLLSATALLNIAGGLTVSLTKMASATAQVVVDGACNAGHVVMMRLSALLDMSGSLVAQKIRPLDVSGYCYAEIDGTLTPEMIRQLSTTSTAEMDGSLAPLIIRGLSAAGGVVFDGYCRAIDIYTGPAPTERTSYIAGSDRTSYMER